MTLYGTRRYDDHTRQDLLDRITELEELLGMRSESPAPWGLTLYEGRVLGCLLAGKGLMSRDRIFAIVWGADSETETKTVDVYMSKIRRRLRPLGITIECQWGGGWYLTPEMKGRIRSLIEFPGLSVVAREA